MRLLLIIPLLLVTLGCEKTIKEANAPTAIHSRASYTIAFVRSTAAANGLAYSAPNSRR